MRICKIKLPMLVDDLEISVIGTFSCGSLFCDKEFSC